MLEKLDRELVVLAQGTAALKLGVGEALDELGAHGGPLELGFSSLEGYARERCEQSGRWARDGRALARRLRERPAMRAALLAGELGWSMAELLSRHGEPASETELLGLARGKTVRQMRQLLREQSEQGDGGSAAGDGVGAGGNGSGTPGDGSGSYDDGDREPEPLVTLTVTMTAEEAWAFECTKMLLQALGARNDGDVVDRLLAESMTTLLGAVPGAADELELSLDCAPFANPEHEAMHQQWQQQLASWRDEAEARCEPRIPERAPAPSELHQLIAPRDELPADAIALDRVVVELSKRLVRRDLDLGDRLQRLCDGNGWRRLGYASLGQYARERLGLSLASVKARMALARRVAKLAPLRTAIEQAELGFEAAMLVGRVATEHTVQAWVARAKRRTIKHLGEEVAAVEVLARTSGQGGLPPPDAETLAAMMALESQVLSGRIFRGEPEPGRGQMSVGASSGDEDANSRCEVAGAGTGSMAGGAVDGSLEGQMSVSARPSGAVDSSPESQMSVSARPEELLAGCDAGQMSVGAEPEKAFASFGAGQMSVSARPEELLAGCDAGQMSVGARPGEAPASVGAGQMSVGAEPEKALASFGAGQAVGGRLIGAVAGSGAGQAVEDEPVMPPPRRGAGKVPIRWRVPKDVARAWHALAKIYRRSSFAGSFVELLCLIVWRTWEPTLGADVAYADLYARERYRCSNPVCFSRNQTPHHLRFRSQGGDDRPENLTSPCACCHLDGIHGGRIRAHGSAPELLWQLGRQPILEVHGRERRQLTR